MINVLRMSVNDMSDRLFIFKRFQLNYNTIIYIIFLTDKLMLYDQIVMHISKDITLL